MGNIISTKALSKAIAIAQDYINNIDLEEGLSSTTLRDEDYRIEIDVELRCSTDLKHNSGSYLVPPSVSGSITNTPVSVIVWFFDKDWDNPTDKDITNSLKSYTYYC